MPHELRRPSAASGPLPGLALTALLVPVLAACSSGAQLPTPRPLVVHSGARLTVDAERMAEVDVWVQDAVQTIQEDPTFLIEGIRSEEAGYPWEATTLEGDTARVELPSTAPDTWVPYRIYGFLHLMADDDRLEEWLPDAVGATGYELERAILARVADTWLYGRTVWDTAPFQPLDELIYARENGYLDPYLLTLRAEEFEDAREAWIEANPGRLAEYREWFRATFEEGPPPSGG